LRSKTERIITRRSKDDQLQRDSDADKPRDQQQTDCRKLHIARQMVITTLQRVIAQGLDWQNAESLSDRELAAKLFPQEPDKPNYKMPDYGYVHGELSKPGVTQQLLWFEYCDRRSATGAIPSQLTQFKKYYREYVVKNKATMHINRKPGEILEVDWAGQVAKIKLLILDEWLCFS